MFDPDEIWNLIEGAFQERCNHRAALLAELRGLPEPQKRGVATLIAERVRSSSTERIHVEGNHKPLWIEPIIGD